MFYPCLSLIALALFISLTLGCGSTVLDAGDGPTHIEATGTPTNIPPTVDATKEHLASLPIGERMRAQWHLDQEKQEELKRDARKQIAQWITEYIPKCQDFYGTGNCPLSIMELQPSEVCSFKFDRWLLSMDEVRSDGHYFITLAKPEHNIFGGYVWIASYGHEAYYKGTVLNIIDCWAENPSEIGQDPVPTRTPGPTSIFNDWQPSR